VTVDDQFMVPSFRVVREIKHGEERIIEEIKHGEERIIEEIKHLSHKHNLILNDKVDDDLKCDGCMLPISQLHFIVVTVVISLLTKPA
jgi:hypothetical protein